MKKGLLQKDQLEKKKPVILSKRLVIAVPIIIIVLLIISVGYWQLNKYQQVRNKDLERLAEMRELQAAFEAFFNDNYSYQGITAFGCQEGDTADKCNLEAYFPLIDYLKDPADYNYLVTKTPSQNSYEITFTLENGAGELVAGQHTLSELGIR